MYKSAYSEAINQLDTCAEMIYKTEQLNVLQERNIAGLEEEISALVDVIESYKRDEKVNADIKKQLRKQTRKRKFWQAVGIGAGTGFIATLIIILL